MQNKLHSCELIWHTGCSNIIKGSITALNELKLSKQRQPKNIIKGYIPIHIGISAIYGLDYSLLGCDTVQFDRGALFHINMLLPTSGQISDEDLGK
jgi:hypothetical protein